MRALNMEATVETGSVQVAAAPDRVAVPQRFSTTQLPLKPPLRSEHVQPAPVGARRAQRASSLPPNVAPSAEPKLAGESLTVEKSDFAPKETNYGQYTAKQKPSTQVGAAVDKVASPQRASTAKFSAKASSLVDQGQSPSAPAQRSARAASLPPKVLPPSPKKPNLADDSSSMEHAPKEIDFEQPSSAQAPRLIKTLKKTPSESSLLSSSTLSPATLCPSLSQTLPPGYLDSYDGGLTSMMSITTKSPTENSSPSRLSAVSLACHEAREGATSLSTASTFDAVDHCRQRLTSQNVHPTGSDGGAVDEDVCGLDETESCGSSPTIMCGASSPRTTLPDDAPPTVPLVDVRSTPAPLWSASKTCRVGVEGDEGRFGAVQILDAACVSSVSAAVSGLNGGSFACTGECCIVWSSSSHSYYLLFRRGRLEDALAMLSDELPVRSQVAALRVPAPISTPPVPTPSISTPASTPPVSAHPAHLATVRRCHSSSVLSPTTLYTRPLPAEMPRVD